MTIIIIKYMFNTTRLVIIIFQVSYYIGILFYIYCEIAADLYDAYDLSLLTAACVAEGNTGSEAIAECESVKTAAGLL